MNDPDHDDQELRTVKALADAASITGGPCQACASKLCGHDAVFSLVLGYKSTPRCLPCIAAHMRERAADLRERALDYVRHHECFLTAWHRAGELEGFGAIERPPCRWDSEPVNRQPSALPPVPATSAPGPSAAAASATSWDAGDLACGDLVLELRLRLRELPTGGLLDLRATDPGAPLDLPAWCSMTGHALVEARHPDYRIRRK